MVAQANVQDRERHGGHIALRSRLLERVQQLLGPRALARACQEPPECRFRVRPSSRQRERFSKDPLRLGELTLEGQRAAEHPIALDRHGVHLDRACQMLARLLVAAGVVVDPTDCPPDGDGRGVQLQCGVCLQERRVEPTAGREQEREPLMRAGVTGIQLDSPVEFAFRLIPLPIVDEQAPRE